jgi:hypothetical protein
VRDTLKEQGLPASGSVTFVQARTAHEIAKAHLARLKLQERRNEIVDRAKATALVFRLAREERDAWINWPARIAALMAAELAASAADGIGAHQMQKVLEAHGQARSPDHLSNRKAGRYSSRKIATLPATCNSIMAV